MHDLPPSLAIALRLTGAIWIVGLIAWLMGADARIVAATFIVGAVTAIAEWSVAKRETVQAEDASAAGQDDDITPAVQASLPRDRRDPR